MKTSNMRTKGNAKEEEEEALKKGNQAATLTEKEDDDKEEEKAMLSMWDCGSPLYDSYELVSLNHLIDRHLMAFPSSLHGSSNPIITRFTKNSHDVGPDVGSPVKSKRSVVLTSFGKFFMKMRKKKKEEEEENDERRKKNKGMRRGLTGTVVDFLCGGSRKHT